MFISTNKLYAAAFFVFTLVVGTFILFYSTNSVEQTPSDLTKPLQKQVEKATEKDNVPINEASNEASNEVNKEEEQLIPENTKNSESDNTSSSTNNNKLSWYYMPNKEHRLPEVNSTGKALLGQYNGIYHGDVNNKVIYLTFDEGYENGYTSRILDVLKEFGVKVTFFITGDYLKKNPELVKRMINEGHIVGNHTQNHPSLPGVSDDVLKAEINTLTESYKSLTGGDMKYLRPPMGEYSARTLRVTSDMGYKNVFWSVAMADWVPDAGTPEQNQRTIMDRLHNGAVILLHAVNKHNAEMLPDLINECKQQGYHFATINEIK